MGWLASGMDVLSGLWGPAADAAPEAAARGLEPVRKAMLDTLGEAGAAAHPALARRIRYTLDPQALWYLRTALMDALSLRHGEPAARAMVVGLDVHFTRILPAGIRRGAAAPSRGNRAAHG